MAGFDGADFRYRRARARRPPRSHQGVAIVLVGEQQQRTDVQALDHVSKRGQQASLGTGSSLRTAHSKTVFPSCTRTEPILAAEPRIVAAVPVPGLESVVQLPILQEFAAVADDGAPRLEQIALQAREDQARYEPARAPRQSASPRRSRERARAPASSRPGRYRSRSFWVNRGKPQSSAFIDCSAQETGNSASVDDASAPSSPEWFGVSRKPEKFYAHA